MKKNRIIELLGETQAQFIEEAAPKPENRVKRLKWVVFAACICIKSQVGRNEVPTEEFSSNEAIIGSRVYRYHDELVVEINGLYCVYVVLKE